VTWKRVKLFHGDGLRRYYDKKRGPRLWRYESIDGLDEILQPVNMQTSKQINENQNENPNHKSVK
jgi:hypothetical protein